jgi:MFS family permease
MKSNSRREDTSSTNIPIARPASAASLSSDGDNVIKATPTTSEAHCPPPPPTVISPSSISCTATITLIRDIIRQWLTQCVWPGLGLFGESYILFGIGTLQPIFEILHPHCYDNNNSDQDQDDDDDNDDVDALYSESNSNCPTWIVQSMTYSVVLGVMVGMVVIGFLANVVGRRCGSIITASLMSFGATCMVIICTIFQTDSTKLFMSLSTLLFVFGIGVGGEYPLSASSASEQATTIIQQQQAQAQKAQQKDHPQEDHQQTKTTTLNEDDKSTPLMLDASQTEATQTAKDRTQQAAVSDEQQSNSHQYRGRQIQLVFSMQGVGIWVNSVTLMLLLWITKQTGGGGNGNNNNNKKQDYDRKKLILVSQIMYLIGAIILVVVLVTRYFYLQESQVWIQDKKRREEMIQSSADAAVEAAMAKAAAETDGPAAEEEVDDQKQTTTMNKNNNNNLSIDISNNQNNNNGHDDTTGQPSTSDVIVIEASTGAAAEEEALATTRATNNTNSKQSINTNKAINTSPFPFSSMLSPDVTTAPSDRQLSITQTFSNPTVIMSSTISDLSSPTLIWQQEYYERQIMEDDGSYDRDVDLNSPKFVLLFKNYGVRLIGASTAWLLWDVSFYGNKLFQATFLLALTGDETSLLEFAGAATLNSTVALLGYFGAAALIDRPDIGRVKLQTYGFLITGGLFIVCGFSFDQLSSGFLVVLYLLSSFFGQLGPNATTFTIPAEIFPTEQRTLCHGICAACGKLGALIAAVLFHHVEHDADLFLICGYASFAACLISLWTIPETNGLDLLEIDVKWRMTLEGRKGEYTGPANHPDHLSMYERWKKGASIQRHQMPNDWDEYVD